MIQSEKQKAWKQKDYQDNKELFRDKLTQQRKKRREFIWQYKATHPCEICGQSHPATIDFHHRNRSNKDNDISNMVNSCRPIKIILAEIEKCQVLCASCHRIVEWELRQCN